MFLYKCKWCGKLFLKNKNAEKYCSDHCRHEATLEDKREYANRRNMNDKHCNTRIKNIVTLGSLGTNSSFHMLDSFDAEEASVKSQIRMLGI